MTTCSVCTTPYAPVSDDPSPAHPGCAPSDPKRYEAATRGPRTYTGRMSAQVWSVCAGCSRRIEVGDVQALTVIDGRRVWACAACSAETSPQIASTDSPPVPATPAPWTASGELSASEGQIPAMRTTDETTAPRRAA